MEATVRELMGPAFLLLGLSHLVQPTAWIRFFEVVKGTGVAGIIIAMFTLPVGLVLLVGHPVWRWEPAVFLTVAGYGLTLRGTLYFLAPRLADHMIESKMARSPRAFQVAGFAAAVIGGVITWQAWTARLSA
jgi:uncharacterized protein YjeT (DUF2065 family)